MSLLITADSETASFRVRTRLDGTFYRLRFQWSPRFETWSMGIETDSGEAVLESARVVVGADIIGSQTQQGLPAGAIIPIDTSGKGVDPGRNDLGTRVKLVYMTESEVSG